MKAISLSSYADAYKSLKEDQFNRYLNYFGITVKKQESIDIQDMILEILDCDIRTVQMSEFYIGYTIPQISKEFDLLRFGTNFTLNIEVKNNSQPNRVQKQLSQNKYYLRALGYEVKSFAYIAKTNEFYRLDDSENLIKSTIDDLVDIIKNQKSKVITEIDALFKPSEYLVSPLNSTAKFIGGNYFLNGNQLTVRDEIIKIINQNKLPFVAIEGKPGTGKSLLTYDIAKYYIESGWNVAIFHCGMLSEGHEVLSRKNGWNIFAAKEIDAAIASQNFDLIVVDETQRIYSNQLKNIINTVTTNKINCIFAYDREQIFTSDEMHRDTAGVIEQLNHKKYKLTDKIRTNKEVASFISNLFNKRNVSPGIDYKNIHLCYFDSAYALKDYLKQLRKNDWEVINYTSSNRYVLSYDKYQVGQQNAHKVIGQEFDRVAAVINQHFSYNSEGRLISSRENGAPKYRLDKMLYQMLTRARQEITIIIYKNPVMLEACLQILNR
ncbi:DNA/RNA helicase domain-containing protein [Paenibacillus sp. DCT19]|uniref:DNA/RNA helicase domain-containing protein n=1 Tax=Paenibacillus sp. DCT19 TaxID=2211212 RepID=UPI000FE26013|nr:DNA/RNA helicase domain-containing protein [Paenibacillus sp. DCT19]